MYYRIDRFDINGEDEPQHMMTCELFTNAFQWMLDKAAKYHTDDVKWCDNYKDVYLAMEVKDKHGTVWAYCLRKFND